jgi:hypothetical protein
LERINYKRKYAIESKESKSARAAVVCIHRRESVNTRRRVRILQSSVQILTNWRFSSMTTAIGYVRSSTSRQEESLDQQRDKLTAFAASKAWALTKIHEVI